MTDHLSLKPSHLLEELRVASGEHLSPIHKSLSQCWTLSDRVCPACEACKNHFQSAFAGIEDSAPLPIAVATEIQACREEEAVAEERFQEPFTQLSQQVEIASHEIAETQRSLDGNQTRAKTAENALRITSETKDAIATELKATNETIDSVGASIDRLRALLKRQQ